MHEERGGHGLSLSLRLGRGSREKDLVSVSDYQLMHGFRIRTNKITLNTCVGTVSPLYAMTYQAQSGWKRVWCQI